MTEFMINGHSAILTLNDFESSGCGGGWRNGLVTLADGRTFAAGGGWILTAESARHENNCHGLQPEEFPDMVWPGAVSAGDFAAYEGWDNGDIAKLAEAVGFDISDQENWKELVDAIRDASERAAKEVPTE